MAGVVSDVSVLSVGTDSNTAVCGYRFEVGNSVGPFAVVAVGRVEFASNAAGLAEFAEVGQRITEVATDRANGSAVAACDFLIVDAGDCSRPVGDIFTALAGVQSWSRAGFAARSAHSAVVVIGSNDQSVVLPRRTQRSAVVILLIQKVVKSTLETVGGRRGAPHAFTVAGHAQIGHSRIDVLSVGTGGVADGGANCQIVEGGR